LKFLNDFPLLVSFFFLLLLPFIRGLCV
jgi:hypothetical protein